MNKIMKKILVVVISLALLETNVFADNNVIFEKNNRIEIDENAALTIGLLFVVDMLDEYKWDETTQIDLVRPMYNAREEMAYYYISLLTQKQIRSYIVVSADSEKPLIAEFSDNSVLSVRMKNNDEAEEVKPIIEVSSDIRLYYDSFTCANAPLDTERNENGPERKRVYRDITEKVLNFITQNEIQLINSCGYGFLENPITYLQSKYPSNYSISVYSANTVSNGVYSYTIPTSMWNGCVVCGTACILKRYAPTGTSYSEIFDTCKSVAEDYGYATYTGGQWNYYIQLGQTANYVNKCIDELGYNKTAASTLLLSQAKTEIDNNRPCLLNIGFYGGVNVDHTVVAYGYRIYNVTYGSAVNTFFCFYVIKDGDCTGLRYACDESITFCFVTKVY